MSVETRIPHSLRTAILLLRIAIGADLLHLGWSAIFTPVPGSAISATSFAGIYGWLVASPYALALEWIFVIAGGAIMIGLATRLASAVLMGLVIASIWPALGSAFHASIFLGEAPLVAICLAVLFLAKAGSYLGLDAFFHFSLRKHKK